MARINLDKLTFRELAELAEAVTTAMAERKDQEKADLKRKVAELAQESGFAVEELFGAARGRRGKAGSAATIKYRNPKDASQTWTGRGRKPNWLVEALGKGQKMDSFLVA